jgi:MFS transporter, FHS family, glucose/mannose:H+ symporter
MRDTDGKLTIMPPEVSVRVSWLSGGSYTAMFIFGIVLALLGSILPLVVERIHFDLAQAGNLFLGMNFAMLVSMLTLGMLMDRFGKKLVLVGGSLLVAIALLVVTGGESYRSLLLGVFLLGVGGGALNGAANTLIADLHADPRKKGSALNLLGVYFGFGALCLPFFIGMVLSTWGLIPILYLAAGLSLVPALLFLLLRFPAPKINQGLPLAEAGQMVRDPLVLLLGFLLFFESGNEFIVGGYTSTYFKSRLGSSISVASYILAAYWAAMMLGRVISSRLLLRTNSLTLVKVSAIGSALGGLLLFLATSVPVATAGVVLLGLSFAGIFPTALGIAGSRFEAYSGTVFGILFGIALSGGMTLPWAVGQISARHGLHAGLSLVIANSFMILILQYFIQTSDKEN